MVASIRKINGIYSVLHRKTTTNLEQRKYCVKLSKEDKFPKFYNKRRF